MKKVTLYSVIKTLYYNGNQKASEVVTVTKNEPLARQIADTLNLRKTNHLVEFHVISKSFELAESPADASATIKDALNREYDDIYAPIN